MYAPSCFILGASANLFCCLVSRDSAKMNLVDDIDMDCQEEELSEVQQRMYLTALSDHEQSNIQIERLKKGKIWSYNSNSLFVVTFVKYLIVFLFYFIHYIVSI